MPDSVLGRLRGDRAGRTLWDSAMTALKRELCAFETHPDITVQEADPSTSLSPVPLPSLPKQASQTRLWPQSRGHEPGTEGWASGTSSRELTAPRSKLGRGDDGLTAMGRSGPLKTPLHLSFGFSEVGSECHAPAARFAQSSALAYTVETGPKVKWPKSGPSTSTTCSQGRNGQAPCLDMAGPAPGLPQRAR